MWRLAQSDGLPDKSKSDEKRETYAWNLLIFVELILDFGVCYYRSCSSKLEAMFTLNPGGGSGSGTSSASGGTGWAAWKPRKCKRTFFFFLPYHFYSIKTLTTIASLYV